MNNYTASEMAYKNEQVNKIYFGGAMERWIKLKFLDKNLIIAA